MSISYSTEQVISSEKPSILLNEGVCEEWQAPTGEWKFGSEAEPLQLFMTRPLDCKKTSLFEYQFTSFLR